MLKTVVWIIVIWIIISLIYAKAKGEDLDMNPFVAEIKIGFEEHPIITVIILVIVCVILFNILF